jgi:TonB family protein
MPKEKPPEPEPAKEVPKRVETVDQDKREIVDTEKLQIMDTRPSNEPQSAANTPAGPPGPANAPAGPPGSDGPPAGDRLGLDTEGTGGSDEFGLVARKGGRSITAGGGGSGRPGGGGSGPAGGGGPVRIGGIGSGKGGGDGSGSSLLDKFSWYTQIVKTEISKNIQKQLDENGVIPRGKLQAVVRVSVDSKGAVLQCGIVDSSGNHEMDEAVKRSIGYFKVSQPPPDGMPRTMIIRVTSQS